MPLEGDFGVVHRFWGHELYHHTLPNDTPATRVSLDFRAVPGPGGNSAAALLTLQILFILVPGVLLVLASWALKNYPLTAARHNEIRQALDARDAEAQA